MSKYPDISHHHPVNDWNKIEENCPFLITKATQGTSFIDSAMNEIIKECENRGIPYWLYVYLNKDNELEQTKFMVETCKDKIGENFIGYILDVEAGNTASGVQKAMDYLKTLDKKMMIYTMYAQYDTYKNIIKNRPSKCAWWEARYGLNDGTYSSKYPCHDGVDLHQFTSQGTCPGISDKIDLNRITGTEKDVDWFSSKLNEDKEIEGRVDGVKYFSTLKNKTVKGITKFLHNRGWGAGEHNLSLIASANCSSDEVKDALFELAKKGVLIKPDGLNEWKE